jgi:hypothetical protein
MLPARQHSTEAGETGMGGQHRWLAAALILAIAWPLHAVPLAAAPICLSDSSPIEGELQQVKTRSAGGRALSGYVLQLGGSACADVTDLDGAPAQLTRVRMVQIIATDRTGQQALERLLGSRIRVVGHLDAPDPERHTGNAVLSNAQLVAVISRVTKPSGPSFAEQAPEPNAPSDYAPASADVGVGTALQPPLTNDATATVDPIAPPSDPDRLDLESRLAEFVEDFYLSGEALEPDVIRSIYAPRVNYFGKRNMPVEKIARDKLAYYQRWPARSFTLKPNTLEVRQIGYDGALYDLSFVYDFNVSAVGRARSGRGYGRLQIDLSDGQGKIIRESGKVIERN